MAAKPGLETGKPPHTYRLDEVSLRLTRQPGNGAFPVRRVNLSGAGAATLERDGRKLPFHYAPKDLLALLNELYKIRFFDLPTNYRTRYSLFLKEDGSVGTSALRLSDESSTSVCIAVAAYEKCVTYGSEAPYELEHLAKRIFSEADRLVNVGQTKG